MRLNEVISLVIYLAWVHLAAVVEVVHPIVTLHALLQKIVAVHGLDFRFF